MRDEGVYRNQAYAMGECQKLARQLVAIAESKMVEMVVAMLKEFPLPAIQRSAAAQTIW